MEKEKVKVKEEVKREEEVKKEGKVSIEELQERFKKCNAFQKVLCYLNESEEVFYIPHADWIQREYFFGKIRDIEEILQEMEKRLKEGIKNLCQDIREVVRNIQKEYPRKNDAGEVLLGYKDLIRFNFADFNFFLDRCKRKIIIEITKRFLEEDKFKRVLEEVSKKEED